MDLDHIQVVLRPRSHWEAIDLGVRLAQRWWWPLTRDWLVLALPSLIVLQALLMYQGAWAILIFWWLKPLWERPLLLDLSRRLFGETLSLRELLRLSWKEGRIRLLADLSWRRLNPHRSLAMPVAVLERQHGPALKRRERVLSLRAGTVATALTVVGIHLENLLVFAVVALAYLLLPREVEFDWYQLLTQEGWTLWLSSGLTLLAMGALAPFYVACGFCLYLNRRTELEAWDIELAFRQLARRLSPLLLIAVLVLGGFAQELQAEAAPDREAIQAAVEEVLAGEDFHQLETQKIPRFVLDWRLAEADDDDPERTLPAWISALRDILAHGAEILLWTLFLLLAAWLLVRFYRQRSPHLASDRGPTISADSTQRLFGLALTEDSLPDNIPQAANDLWQQGAGRPALALLYRGALAALVNQFGLRLRDGYTEGDCLRLARARLEPASARYFSRLTQAWQRAAYAHILPDDGAMQSLSEGWRQAFMEPQQ